MTRRTHWLGGLAAGLVLAVAVGVGCRPAAEPGEPDDPPIDVPEADLKAVADGNNAFAIDLYKKLAEKESGNIFFSPYSLSSALAMTYAGARGETAAQMAKVLGIDTLGDKVHPAHADLASRLKSRGEKGQQESHIANALWGQQGLPFRDEFLTLTRKSYGAGLREVNYADTDVARKTINKWVGEQTRENIPELLKPNHLTSRTRLVLTNAVYFRADWAHPFEKESTKDGPFHRTPTDHVTVPLMRQNARLRYAELGKAQVVELPYAGGQFSMFVILPGKVGDLGDIEQGLTGAVLGEWLGKTTEQQINLILPRFQLRMATELKRDLSRMGMPLAFTDAADFSGMTETTGLQISMVAHEAWVDVDERGTEAAAATAVGMELLGSRQIPEFHANRPFIFAIRHSGTGSLTFVGRVTDPSAKN